MDVPQARSLAVRIRAQARVETCAVALQLFVRDGFENVTVEDICREAGLSRRSFFRYFRSKDDVVVGVFSELAEAGCARFTEAIGVGGDVWSALRLGFQPFSDWIAESPELAFAMLTLIDATPSLRANYLERLDRWRQSLMSVMGAELAKSTDANSRAVIASSGVAALKLILEAWAADRGQGDPAGYCDNVLANMKPALLIDRHVEGRL